MIKAEDMPEKLFGIAGGWCDFKSKPATDEEALLSKAASYSARPCHKMAASQNFGKKGEKRKANGDKGEKCKAKNPVSNAPVAPPEVPAKNKPMRLENCCSRGCFVALNIPKCEHKTKTFNYKKYGGADEAHKAALDYMDKFF